MNPSCRISLNTALLNHYIDDKALTALQPRVNEIVSSLFNKTCAGNDFLGWIDLPMTIQKELPRIRETARRIHEQADHLVCIGIGGSYLGAKSAIEFLADPFTGNRRVLFFGQNISAEYSESLLQYILQKQVCVNVISKSGTTTEPAIAFRLIRNTLAKKYSENELKKRIYATTDRARGVMRHITDEQGYESFIIEDDIGGRFSVLSPVGLLPIAAAGYDIDALVAGAADMAQFCRDNRNVLENPALTYAAARFSLYQQGKLVEILSSFEPSFTFLGEWWKQLFGESEGKDLKGIYPTSANLTTDLHSLGQFMQEGRRLVFETFLMLQQVGSRLVIPDDPANSDQLNFISGRTIDDVNRQAFLGTKFAHYAGDLPNMTMTIPLRNEYVLGQLYYLFEFAVAVSGLLLGVNPFNQPGVEAYKQNMFALLGKPEYEAKRLELQRQIDQEGTAA
ncbi:MAG: glucose-6-phosphate isomerase [Calditrichaeota bacterium]|nr:MAG: glucose-6-phosphate isomerase [Calditrichota bacterium]